MSSDESTETLNVMQTRKVLSEIRQCYKARSQKQPFHLTHRTTQGYCTAEFCLGYVRTHVDKRHKPAKQAQKLQTT